MFDTANISIFAGSGGQVFAERMCKYMGKPLSSSEVITFSEGNTFVRINESVRDCDVFLVQPIGMHSNNEFVEILFWMDAFKRANAHTVTLVMPYFGYAKGDKKDEPRVSIRARVCAECMELAGADRFVTMDLHAQQIQGFFKRPMDHLYARPVLVPYLKQLVGDDPVVVAPDSGSAKMAMNYGDMLGGGFAVVAKRRINATTVASSHLVGDVRGKVCVITDDLTSTCGTLIAAAKLLKENGATKVYAAVSHCLLNETGQQKLLNAPEIEALVTTDAVPQTTDLGGKVKVVSIAPLLGEAIRRIHDGKSVSSLFYINH